MTLSQDNTHLSSNFNKWNNFLFIPVDILACKVKRLRLTLNFSKMLIILLVLIVQLGPETAGLDVPSLSNMQDIIGLAREVSDIASRGLSSEIEGPVQGKLNELSKRIEELSSSLKQPPETALWQIVTIVPRETDLRARMNQLGSYISRVTFHFKVYQRISKSNSTFKYNVNQFIETATSMGEDDIIQMLGQMRKLFTGGQGDDTQESLVSIAASNFANMDPSDLCGKTMSRQQKVYDFHRMVVIAEIKGFLMTVYAYGMLGAYRNRSFKKEIKQAEERLISSVSDYIKATKEGLANVPRDVYVCDPSAHRFGRTFVELSRAVQLTVLHEIMLRPSFSCAGSCSSIDTQTIYRYTVDAYEEERWEPKMKCQGRITDCRDLNNVDICEMDIEEDDDVTIDRLVYVKTKRQSFGDPDRCAFAEESHLERFPFLYEWCKPCMCTCVEEKKTSNAIRAFSLRPQVTDIDNNMVLTGVAFETKDKMIHLQIQQGKLIKEGKIEAGSEKWVSLERFDYTEEGSWQGGFVIWENDEKKQLEEKVDYVFIHYERRKIHLDDIVATEEGYVVTGAKLKVSTQDPGAIALAIRLTRFNYTTGELIAQEDGRNVGEKDQTNTKIHSVWLDDDFISSQTSRGGRTKIDVTNKKDPVRSYGNVPDSPDHSEVMITHSNDREDVGQATIPYFDRERSGPVPSVALDGLGFYHRGNGESGGFIGVKTFTHDLSKYLDPKIDPSL